MLPDTRPTEDKLQTEIFQWHWNNMPEERRRLFHVNQKARNKIEGNRMKAMGVVAGVSDLIYLTNRGAIFIELKSEDGRQSIEQKQFQVCVESIGFRYVIIRKLEEFQKLIITLNYGSTDR